MTKKSSTKNKQKQAIAFIKKHQLTGYVRNTSATIEYFKNGCKHYLKVAFIGDTECNYNYKITRAKFNRKGGLINTSTDIQEYAEPTVDFVLRSECELGLPEGVVEHFKSK